MYLPNIPPGRRGMEKDRVGMEARDGMAGMLNSSLSKGLVEKARSMILLS